MSLFGAPKPFGSTFGQPAAAPASNPFGQTSTATTGGSLFGGQQQQTQQPQQQTSAFGGSMFNQTQQAQPQQQQAQNNMNASQIGRGSLIWEEWRDAAQNQKPVLNQVENLYNKWNPDHPSTNFKHYFYNKVDQSRIPFYQPSANEDPREWEQAVHDKPAPGFMPALATGFAAVAERLKMQKNVLAQFNQALHQINATLDAILSQHDLQTSVRALNARRKHAILRQRCLALASKVQVLRNRGYALDKEEDELKTKFETLDRGITDPALSARTEELWSRLIMLRGYADSLNNELNRRGPETQEGLGEEAEAKAKKILEDYDKQLQTLKSQVESIKKDYEEWEKERNPTGEDKN